MSTSFLGGGAFDFAKDTFESVTGKTAAEATEKAARTQAEAQQNALNYLREREAIPQQYREGALGLLGGLYGLNTGAAGGAGSIPPRPEFQASEEDGILGAVKNKLSRERYEQDLADWERQYGARAEAGPMPSQQEAMAQITSNPIYQATLGQLPQQEEAILRNQSATGALRTGGTDAMLAENQRQNQLAALQNTMGGLQGLAGLQSYAPQIAQGMIGIGQTQAQGLTGAANVRQQALGGLLQAGANVGAAAFSDIRLKTNIKPAGTRYGQEWFTWDWNDEAGALGLFGEDEGVIADYLRQTRPELVGESNGYLTVNYRELENG